MSCNYNLVLTKEDGTKETLTFDSASSDFSWQDFAKELLKKPYLKNQFKALVNKGKKTLEILKNDKKLIIPNFNSFEALNVIKSNLQTLGVKMLIISDEEMNSLFSNDTTAAVRDGVVYVRKGARVTAPIHELMHLVFAVIRSSDPDRYVKMMESVGTSEIVQKEIKNLPNNYKSILTSEITEEAFVRVLEKLLNNELSAEDTKLITEIGEMPIWDYLNKTLKKDIEITFGIKKIDSVPNFLKSKISELPLAGNNWFVRSNLKTTGYGQKKQQAILGARVLNFIQKYSEGENPLIKRDCK